MPPAPAAALYLRCSSCRYSIVNTFTALAGVPLGPSRSTASSIKTLARRRAIIAAARPSSSQARQPDALDAAGITDEGIPPPQPRDSAPVAAIPWYLQPTQPTPQIDESHPRADRQQLPELPSEPPPILQDLLNHVSLDLGLDDLILLDLRKLDPPPALGSNLLMIVGTARSEKHLHVSADRFCRWLRSEHKLTPYGDGLLGRNELKLKLRRRNRRMKIMANAGASNMNAREDGLRTGWVCVNVGRVEPAAEQEDALALDDATGFGRRSDKVSIVVQMLTEDKRADVDLEGLWKGVLHRAEKRASRASQEGQEYRDNKSPQTERKSSLMQATTKSSLPFGHTTRSAADQTYSIRAAAQVRSHHTSSRSQVGAHLTKFPILLSFRGLAMSPPAHHTQLSSSTISFVSTSPGLFDQNEISPGSGVRSVPEILEREESTSTHQYGEYAPQNASGDSEGSASSQFILDTAQAGQVSEQDTARSNQAATSQLELLREAHSTESQLELPECSESNLLPLLENMLASATPVQPAVFETILSALLNKPSSAEENKYPPSQESLEKAFTVLEWMEGLGYDVSTARIWTIFNEAVSRPSPDPVVRDRTYQTQARLLRWMDMFKISFDDHMYALALQSFYRVGNTDAVWETWHGIARRMRRRSESLYELMFRQMAITENQMWCIETLRNCVPEIQLEVPSVQMTRSLAEAIMGCVLVVEPDVERLADTHGLREGEWAIVWRRCRAALAQGYTPSS